MTVRQLEEGVSAVIAALDASDYDQGTVEAKWTESQIPAVADAGVQPLAHLCYVAHVASSVNTGNDRDETSEYCRLRSSLVVAFGYHLRPGVDQIADSRLATDAAHDVVRAVMGNWTTQANVNLANAGEYSIAASGEYAMVVISFDVLHDLSI